MSIGTAHPYTEYDLAGFLSQEIHVEITPKFSTPRIDGVSGTFGPFTPNYPIQVPLWLALFIKQANACAITCPPYLLVPALQACVEGEKEVSNFTSLPYYFFEIAAQLTTFAANDVPNCPEVIRLVDELREKRYQKIRQTFGVLSSNLMLPGLQISLLTAGEVNHVRATMGLVLETASQLEATGAPKTLAEIPRHRPIASETPGSDRRTSDRTSGRLSTTTFAVSTTQDSTEGAPSIVAEGMDLAGQRVSTEGGPVQPQGGGAPSPLQPVADEAPTGLEDGGQTNRRRRTLRQR